jgi:hypothetical protein
MKTTDKTTKPSVQEQIDRLQSELIMLRNQATNSINGLKAHVNDNIAMNTRLRCLELAIEKSGGIHADPVLSATDLIATAVAFAAYVNGKSERVILD